MLNTIITENADSLSRRLGLPKDKLVASLKYWSSRCPPDYREDTVQEIALVWLESLPGSVGLAYAIARNTVGHLWEKWHTREHYGTVSLDKEINEGSGRTIADMIAGVVDYEAQICGAIDGSAKWKLLPAWVQKLVAKKLNGFPVRGGDAIMLRKWATANASILID